MNYRNTWPVALLLFGWLLMASKDVLANSYDDPTWHEYAEGVFGFETAWLTSVVVEGRDGMLIMDTYNRPHAEALKSAIENKFGKQIKYVVYSHAHADHIRGSTLLADGAEVIAQRRQLPRLNFLISDGESIATPTILFDDEYRLKIGGREVILKDYGDNHATGITVMVLPDDKIIAVFDIIFPRRLLWYNMPDYYPRQILRSLKEIAEVDFETLITSHGPPADRGHLLEYISFMEDLIGQVQAVIDRDIIDKGPVQALINTQEEVDLSKYEDWGYYNEWRDRNVEAVFHSLFMGF